MAGEHWTGQHLVALLAAVGVRPGGVPDVALVDVPVVGTEMPAMPHRVALAYEAPAPGEALEGAAEWVGWVLRVRWDPRDPVGAQQAALEAHRALTRAPFPMWVGGVRVHTVTAPSGRPAPAADDPATSGDSTIYQCTYLALVSEFDDHE